MRKIGNGGSAPALVILSLLALFGFFAWLYMQATAEVEEVPVVEESEPEVIALADLGSGTPEDLVGKFAEIESAEVERGLGRGVFMLRIGEATYPVLLSADLINQGVTPRGGDRVNLKGRVYTLNDSIRSAWLAEGAIESMTGISAAGSFLLADSARVTN